MQSDVIVELKNISVGYEDREVLSRVNLSVARGDFMGIIGPNGSGKTTLVKTIMGLHSPMTGAVTFYPQSNVAGRIKIGYLPQLNMIDRRFPISVKEVITSGLSGEATSPLFRFTAAQRQRVDQVVEQMGLEELIERPIGQLSGGQLQRTLLGRALVSEPQLLILDEPGSYVDRTFEEKLYKLLLDINRTTTLMMVSHDIASVLALAKTIACVNGHVHTHPNRELPPDWIHSHFNCSIDLFNEEIRK